MGNSGISYLTDAAFIAKTTKFPGLWRGKFSLRRLSPLSFHFKMPPLGFASLKR
jgi:hypothetical protein